MDDDDIAILAIVLAIILCCVLVFLLVVSSGQESIRNDVLDEACRTMYNDTDAEYYQEFGFQKHFPCKIGNKILVVEPSEGD